MTSVMKSLLLLFAFGIGARSSPPLLHSRMILSNDGVTERIGTYKMLAVRVTTTFGQEPRESMEEIEGHVFGTGVEAVENFVVSQFDAVSRGKLHYVPAVDSGVVEIEMDQKIGFYRDTEAEMISATEALFGGTRIDKVADRILFCLPDGTLGDGVWGKAQLVGRLSFFHKGGCKKLALLMHELGHNLGFAHSGIEDDEYEDRSGYMGGSKGQKINNIFKILINLIFKPNDDRMLLKAYNGHKQWISGWFDDSKLAVDLSVERRAFSMRLVCFVDADFSNDYAVLRLDRILYLQYNCGKAYNVDTEVPNTLTIVRAVEQRGVSMRLASLRSGKMYEYLSTEDEYWNIQLCSIHQGDVDYAEISVHRSGEEHKCEKLLPTPWSVQVGEAIGLRSGEVWTWLYGGFLLFGAFFSYYYEAILSCMKRKKQMRKESSY